MCCDMRLGPGDDRVITRVPLIKSIMFLAYRLACDQGIILKACRNLVKDNNAEHE